jgi:hypothetical protein
MRQTVNLFIVAMCVAVPAMAQDFQTAPPAQAARAMAPMPTPMSAQRGGTPAATEAPRRADPGVDQTDANIKLVLTITDKGGPSISTKTVTLIVANQGSGRVRANGQNPGKQVQLLNVDATAELRKSGLTRVNLTIVYSPERTDTAGATFFDVNESLSIFLKDGMPMVIAQAVDPANGAHSVSIEVTASVLK